MRRIVSERTLSKFLYTYKQVYQIIPNWHSGEVDYNIMAKCIQLLSVDFNVRRASNIRDARFLSPND